MDTCVSRRSFCTGSVTPSHLHRSPTRTQQRRQQAGRVRAEGEFRVPKPPKVCSYAMHAARLHAGGGL